ncbi:MAG TPA: hypothetical protein VH877_24745 [Polyangia bacterium]|jgi:hypothetical protein|nr:hypothetical protein [Polyangia bacterium]
MQSRCVQSDGSVKVEDERGRATLLRLRPGVVLLTYTGHVRLEFFEPLRQGMEREFGLAQVPKKPLVIIVDCWELQGIDTKFRERLEFWLKCHRGEIASVISLVKSKLVVMASNIMSLFLGGGLMISYSEPREFEMAIERCVPGLGWHRSASSLQPVAARG